MGANVSIGPGVEINALGSDGIVLGDHVTIDAGAILRATGVVRHLGRGIHVGARSSIGAYNILLGQGGVFIGEDCLLGPHVTVVSENHTYDRTDKPIREQGELRSSVVIDDDVWLALVQLSCLASGLAAGRSWLRVPS